MINEQDIRVEQCRRHLWNFEQYMDGDFFKHPHLKIVAETLENLYKGKLLKMNGEPYKKLMINMPPRFGKSYSLNMFCQWVLGNKMSNKIITISYNEVLSGRFSKGVRNAIESEKVDNRFNIFGDIFPDAKIKRGDSSASLWSLEGQPFSYLGGSFGGTVTGMGCNIGIIDDPIKNRDEAYNDKVLQQHWDFYADTFLSRLEEGAIQIINMTRWSTKDLCGRLLDLEPNEWYVISMEAKTGDTMLCPEIMSLETYLDKSSKTSNEIMLANYHQKPMDVQGRLYENFKTYVDIPVNNEAGQVIEGIFSYTDTADTGDDYLCSIIYALFQGKAYVLDIYYTQDSMEITETDVANKHTRFKVNKARIESNNGGRGFARNVDRVLKEMNNYTTVVSWFHQSSNKKSRILSNSYWVQENIYMPLGWEIKFRDFYIDVMGHQKSGKNKHDDAADALTGIAESITVKRSKYTHAR